MTLNAHMHPIEGLVFFPCNGVAFSPDGRRIASTGWYNMLMVWNTSSGQETLVSDSNVNTGVAFSPDGRRIASGSEDSTVKLWDAGNGQGDPLPRSKDTPNLSRDFPFQP